MTTLELSEEFDDSAGRFVNYDAYEASDRLNIWNQKHADIRVFENREVVGGVSVLTLSTETMSTLSPQTVGDISSAVTQIGEGWSTGIVAPDPTRNNWRGITLPYASAEAVTESIQLDRPVDIVTNFDADDFISVALPDYKNQLDKSKTYLELISINNGIEKVSRLSFSQSILPLIVGDMEFRARRFDLVGDADLSNIVGVRIRYASSSAGEVGSYPSTALYPSTTLYPDPTPFAPLKIMAIRILAKSWQYSKLDFDTHYNTFRHSVTPNANVSTVSAFTPPIVWRSALPSGENTARPINAKFGTIFNTGEKRSTNSITNYFRELTEDYLTQLDINGLDQSNFNDKVQPDVGEARYNSRTQSDLEPFSQTALEEQTQFWLERTPDFFSASWIEFKCQWSSGGDQVSITNTEVNGYTLPISPALEPNKEYVFFTELEDNSVRAIIYPLETDGSIQNKKVFDSTLITDDTTFPRRKGRFGWRAELNDYSSYIKAIRSHGVTYAEYRSLPFESFTPVRGAELFTDTIPHKELFTGFSVGPFNDSNDTTVDRDKSQSISGESFRITTRGNKTQQGITSNAFKVENFDETKIELNLYRALDIELNVLLINNETQRIIPFVLPRLAVNQWQRIILNIPNQPILAGQYKFAILQPDAIPAMWWIDNVSIYERSISWSGRAVVDDPWKNNIAPWTPYKDFVNQDNSGVLFAERGNQLQVRARALQQNTRISRVQVKPQYAQLGRLVWPENEIQGAHLISINSTVTVKSVRLSYTVVSENSNNSIILAEWNLGNGVYKVGSVVDYTYDQAGTYTISLITTDKDGFRNIATQQITITVSLQGTTVSTSVGSGAISRSQNLQGTTASTSAGSGVILRNGV